MLRPRFHTQQDLLPGTAFRLEREPSRHIAKALRMRPGDRLCLFDGAGTEASAVIREIERDRVGVEVVECRDENRESPLDLALAISLSRGDRMDTVVQKATELGVTRILPLISERTGVRLDAARLAKKREHWIRIAISACEQCGRNTLPEINEPVALARILDLVRDSTALKLLLHPDVPGSALPGTCEKLVLLVGPEGGFSPAEVDAALDAGFEGTSLGPRVLRTETAPLAAITLAQARWGDLPGL